MSTFREIFPDKHTLLVVIHADTKRQVLRNIEIASDEGADGVFLINHQINFDSLLNHYAAARERWPNFWIGLNCLDLGLEAIRYIPSDADGLWTDSAGIDEDGTLTAAALEFSGLRKQIAWNGIYFGGVAFKYQKEVADPAKAAHLASLLVDVITTSGQGTGIAADTDKIRKMKEAIGNHPLAIASGITPENVVDYMPISDCFLVATGISSSATELNPALVGKLARRLGK